MFVSAVPGSSLGIARGVDVGADLRDQVVNIHRDEKVEFHVDFKTSMIEF